MENFKLTRGKYFYVIGLSYQKADAQIRGKFSLTEDARIALYNQALAEGTDCLLTISTCNRTEIYGFAEHPFKLIKLLCDHTNGDVEDFQKVGFVYKNHEAISHFFNVATGLESQILGDFEIIGQIKNSFLEARQHGLTDAYLERMVNAAIQASKKIKSETGLSSGATSVAFAAVKYILHNIPDQYNKIVLYGTGKIGRNTCENLVKHTAGNAITLINRTKEKAEKLAGKFNLIVKDVSDLRQETTDANVLIVATGANQPTINPDDINPNQPILILDLSIPRNVNPVVGDMQNVTLIHMDALSKMTDETLEMRKSFLPDARAIIADIQGDFEEWVEARKFAPTIKALKSKLEEIKNGELDYQSKKTEQFNQDQAEAIAGRLVQKITTLFANHLKTHPQEFDDHVSFIQSIFALENEVKKHEKNY
ncbi:MAG: glutamyl-tRNA reductase [Flavobacteriaceae bacterium]|nr:glutamyl-tRNA reductase [Flavobacteriaceae bacterium]